MNEYVLYGVGGLTVLWLLSGNGGDKTRRPQPGDPDSLYGPNPGQFPTAWGKPVWESPIAMACLLFLGVLGFFFFTGHPIDLPGSDIHIGEGRHFGDWIGPGSGSGGWGAGPHGGGR